MIPLIVDSAAVGLDFAGEDLHWWDRWRERQSRSSSSQIRFILIKVEMFIEGSLTSILGTEQILLFLIEMEMVFMGISFTGLIYPQIDPTPYILFQKN